MLIAPPADLRTPLVESLQALVWHALVSHPDLAVQEGHWESITSRVTRAAFFDRDGVVNELVRDPTTGLPESPLVPDDVVLKPGVAGALKRLRNAGYLLIGISNQPAAAKGSVTLEQLRSVQARVEDLLRAEQVEADAFRLCFHHPEGVVAELALVCDCRKPAPGMLLAAASELEIDLASSWMIGDTDSDVAAGARRRLQDRPRRGPRKLSQARRRLAA